MKSTRPLILPTQDSHGFALISVLALVSLAALSATAFLASARLEKTAAMTTGDQTRLTLALDSGYHLASYVFTRADNTWNWADFLVGEDADGVGYLYHATPRTSTNSGEWTNYALFSCATMSNIGLTLFDPANWAASTFKQGGFASDRLNSASQLCKMTNFSTTNVTPSGPVTRIPLLFSRTSPVVNWITNYVTNPSTGLLSPTFRFAYFTEDPSGLIDVDRMGGSTSRDTGTNPTEIALGEVGITNFGTFTNLRRLFLTPGMIEDVLRTNNVTNASVTNPWRYLSSSLYSMNGLKTDKPTRTQGFLRIPTGLGYNEADTNNKFPAKYNINTNIPLSVIAAAITNNLNNFGTIRSGAMAPTAYISNIAANIVDYIDTDSTPTSDNPNNPTYLGIENIPWPNEIFDQIVFKNSISSPPQLRIQLKDMVEVWNMGDKPIPSGTSISISNNYDMKLTFTNTALNVEFKTNLASMQDVDNGNSTNWTKYRTFTTTNDIPPNGYAVLQADKGVNGTLHFSLGATLTNPAWYDKAAIRAAWFLYTPSDDATTNMAYKARLGNGSSGQVIQVTKDGRATRYLAATNKLTVQPATPNTYIFCNNIGYASQANINNSTPFHTGGDPRAQLFLRGILYQQNYTNQYATPGGRNRTFYWLPGGRGTPKYPESEVNPKMYWPDGGHATNTDLGGDPTLATQSPMTFSSTPATNNWVMKRNDTGAMTNILELGNIYDPMQWGDQAGSGIAGQPGLWTNLTSSATNDSRFGGRNTLRIGRPEFSLFAWTNLAGATVVATPNMMISSAALLDLFCTTNQFDESGQINLNTAPAPVLRALAGGIYLRSDPELKDTLNPLIPKTTHPIPPAMAEAFAQGVMRFRAKYPFYSPSQLSFIGTDPTWPNTNNWPANAVFGNTNTITLSTAPGNTYGSTASLNISEWNDQAAEEWFSKIFKLSTTYSRNFRVYVIAQKATNSAGVNIGVGPVVRKYYNVLTRQNSDAATDVPAASASTLNTFESSY